MSSDTAGLVVFVFGVLFLAGEIFWLVMFIDCLKREYKNGSDKILWAAILLLLNGFGAILYYFIVRRRAKKLEQSSQQQSVQTQNTQNPTQ